jgi:hypothetical protein
MCEDRRLRGRRKEEAQQMKNTLALSAAAVALLIGWGLPAQAASYVVTLTQVGSDAVATGSGEIDLTGLSFIAGSHSERGAIVPSIGDMITGPAPFTSVDLYTVGITGPANFGPGDGNLASSGSGDMVGIAAGSSLFVPFGYVSDTPLNDTATFIGTFASLGATPGVYKWKWGTGANQNFTLDIVAPTTVPEPSTWAMMALGFGLIGGAGYWRRRSVAVAA